jgi:hypothetical protein
MTDEPLPEHVRPDGVTDATVEALGRLSEALEAVEIARGRLYAFHRMSGTADRTLGEAVDLFRKAGHDELADRIQTELFGRNLLHGRWSFQIVEEYDETYWSTFRELEREAREQLIGGRRHVYEAEMKERERTRGHPDHTAVPDDTGPQGHRAPG